MGNIGTVIKKLNIKNIDSNLFQLNEHTFLIDDFRIQIFAFTLVNGHVEKNAC